MLSVCNAKRSKTRISIRQTSYKLAPLGIKWYIRAFKCTQRRSDACLHPGCYVWDLQRQSIALINSTYLVIYGVRSVNIKLSSCVGARHRRFSQEPANEQQYSLTGAEKSKKKILLVRKMSVSKVRWRGDKSGKGKNEINKQLSLKF